jgi:hypothetical protein
MAIQVFSKPVEGSLIRFVRENGDSKSVFYDSRGARVQSLDALWESISDWENGGKRELEGPCVDKRTVDFSKLRTIVEEHYVVHNPSIDFASGIVTRPVEYGNRRPIIHIKEKNRLEVCIHELLHIDDYLLHGEDTLRLREESIREMEELLMSEFFEDVIGLRTASVINMLGKVQRARLDLKPEVLELERRKYMDNGGRDILSKILPNEGENLESTLDNKEFEQAMIFHYYFWEEMMGFLMNARQQG